MECNPLQKSETARLAKGRELSKNAKPVMRAVVLASMRVQKMWPVEYAEEQVTPLFGACATDAEDQARYVHKSFLANPDLPCTLHLCAPVAERISPNPE